MSRDRQRARSHDRPVQFRGAEPSQDPTAVDVVHEPRAKTGVVRGRRSPGAQPWQTRAGAVLLRPHRGHHRGGRATSGAQNDRESARCRRLWPSW